MTVQKSFYLLIYTVLLISCNFFQKEENVAEQTAKTAPQPKPTRDSYQQFVQIYLHNKQQTSNQALREQQFFSAINNSVPLYWTGTPWDFNGTTTIPQKGTIACGYFVTTILSQLGLPVQRVWLAQQASQIIIRKTCKNIYRAKGFDDLLNYINSRPDNTVFIVGLDFHTGFMLKGKKDEIYFLHSNYIRRQGVMKEKAATSAALKASKYFEVGEVKLI